jgi:hypothetical protein
MYVQLFRTTCYLFPVMKIKYFKTLYHDYAFIHTNIVGFVSNRSYLKKTAKQRNVEIGLLLWGLFCYITLHLGVISDPAVRKVWVKKYKSVQQIEIGVISRYTHVHLSTFLKDAVNWDKVGKSNKKLNTIQWNRVLMTPPRHNIIRFNKLIILLLIQLKKTMWCGLTLL